MHLGVPVVSDSTDSRTRSYGRARSSDEDMDYCNPDMNGNSLWNSSDSKLEFPELRLSFDHSLIEGEIAQNMVSLLAQYSVGVDLHFCGVCTCVQVCA